MAFIAIVVVILVFIFWLIPASPLNTNIYLFGPGFTPPAATATATPPEAPVPAEPPTDTPVPLLSSWLPCRGPAAIGDAAHAKRG